VGVLLNNQFLRLCESRHNRKNWLFAGSLRSGKRAAAIMSLIQSARLNGHDPYTYLKDALTRLPTQQANDIAQLLSHRCQLV
jgi:transposase